MNLTLLNVLCVWVRSHVISLLCLLFLRMLLGSCSWQRCHCVQLWEYSSLCMFQRQWGKWIQTLILLHNSAGNTFRKVLAANTFSFPRLVTWDCGSWVTGYHHVNFPLRSCPAVSQTSVPLSSVTREECKLPFLPSLSTFAILCLIYCCPSRGSARLSDCGLNLHCSIFRADQFAHICQPSLGSLVCLPTLGHKVWCKFWILIL